MNIKFLDEISKKDLLKTGGKAASLGEMIKIGLSIPQGFAITTEVFKQFYNQELPPVVEEEIFKAFDNLKTKRVAVRSSAVEEDSKTASWAGQLESFLNVDKKNLIEGIRKCWDSIKSERALSYAVQQNLPKDKLFVAVVVQKMIDSEVSGVMFTINPVTNDQNEIMIEAGYGLGEMIVQGLITPNNFILNKKTLKIKSRDIQSQNKMLVFENGKNREIPVPEDRKDQQVMSDDLIKELGKIAIKIEKHFKNPQDIEWAVDEDNKILVLQSRPITTMQQ